jgi:hypothetical protein
MRKPVTNPRPHAPTSSKESNVEGKDPDGETSSDADERGGAEGRGAPQVDKGSIDQVRLGLRSLFLGLGSERLRPKDNYLSVCGLL